MRAGVVFISNVAAASQALKQRAMHQAEALGYELVNEIVETIDPGPARTGAWDRIPGTKTPYQRSAEGEPHAVREGLLRDAWKVLPPVVEGPLVTSGAYNDMRTEDGHLLADIMEHGTRDGTIGRRPTAIPALEALAKRYGITLQPGD